MKWITRQQVGIDRMASAWLIARFIDPQAAFAFIPDNSAVPEAMAGEPFDMPGVRLTHRHGHCTFHTILEEYALDDPILHRIARIIDEADTIQDAQVEPAAIGVDWICRGLRIICQDDAQALQHGYQLFESLYAYLQSEA